MPPRTLPLSRNHAANALRVGTAVALVAGVSLVGLFVAAMDAFSGGSGSDALLFLLLLGPLLGMVGYVSRLTLRPARLVVHADALEVIHPRMLSRPLVIPRSNVRATYVGDADQPLLRAGRSVGDRDPLRPVIGDGVMPNLVIELISPVAIDQARGAWVAAAMRGEPDPPSPTDPVTAVVLAVADPGAARQALAGWGLQRPASTPAPESAPSQAQGHQLDRLLFAAAFMGPLPFYTAGVWQVAPLHLVLVVLAGARVIKRSRAGWGAPPAG